MKTKHVSRRFRRFLRANEAVSALEYALLVGVVSLGVAGAVTVFYDEIETALQNVGQDISTNAVNRAQEAAAAAE